MKYKYILQQSEEDCGAACLASIALHHGRRFTITRIRELVGTGQKGTTLLGIRRGAELLGFNTRAIKASIEILDQLDDIPLPTILHWKGIHFVVLYEKKGDQYIILDPSVGIYNLSKKELLQGWTDWVMLLLEPDPNRFFNQDDDKDKIGGIGRFLKRTWIYRHLLGEVIIINMVLGLLGITSPFLLQILTDDVLVQGDFTLLTRISLGAIVLIILSNGLSFIQSNLIAHFSQRLELGLVLDFVNHLLHLPLSFYESRRSGEIASRLRDVEQINWLVSQVVIEIPSKLFIAIIALVIMVFYNGKLALFSFLIGILMALPTILSMPKLSLLTRKLLVLSAENQAGLIETFKGAITVKTTTATPQVWGEFQNRFGRLTNLSLRIFKVVIINDVFADVVSGIGNIALLWFGSTLVIRNELTIGQLMAFSSMSSNLISFIDTCVRFTDEFAKLKISTERLTEVLELPLEDGKDIKKSWATIPENSDIICHQVNFQHAGRVKLLDNFSVNFPGGKIIGLIGESGCGKSTLSKLITGLYSLQSGNIEIGGYNLQDIPLDCLRQQIVLLPQTPHFWSLSIIENFRLSYPQIDFEDIIRACEITGANEFINQLPDKYQTVLGEFGSNISGGQLQRLAMARAIAYDPPILILDESTSSLDPLSEQKIMDKLLINRQNKTTILISHRPTVINRTEWIVFLEKGQLKYSGSREDFKNTKGEHLSFINH